MWGTFFGGYVCVFVCVCVLQGLYLGAKFGGRVCLSSNIVQNICVLSNVVPTAIKSIENSVPTTSHQPFLSPVMLILAILVGVWNYLVG